MSANRLGIIWNFKNVVYYLVTIFSGTIIQVSLFLIFATLSFYIMKSSNVRDLMYWQVRKFAGYPLSIFNRLTQLFLMFIVPFAFVNYFPAQYLLRNEDMEFYKDFFIYCSPFVAVFMMIISYLFWRVSIKKYSSTGN